MDQAGECVTTVKAHSAHTVCRIRRLQRMHQMKDISARQRSVIVFIVSCALAFIVVNGSAFAQFKPSLNLSADKPDDPATEAHRKEIEDAYKSKLKTIPDQERKKSDPWGNLRSTEPSKK